MNQTHLTTVCVCVCAWQDGSTGEEAENTKRSVSQEQNLATYEPQNTRYIQMSNLKAVDYPLLSF